MNMHLCTILIICLILLFDKYGECEQVYIKPSQDSSCPERYQACNYYTLMQYVNHTSSYQSSNNVTLMFMPGNHMLSTQFSIATKSCFSMSVYTNASSSCSIMCTGSSKFVLSSIDTVTINGITFIGCRGNRATSVDTFILEDSNFVTDPESYYTYRRAWYIVGSITLIINSCTFTTMTGGGVLYISSVANTIISLSTFNNNTAARGGVQGGVAYINVTNLIINGSTFFNNTASGGSAKGGALYINAANSVINGSIFKNNTVYGGGAAGGALYVKATNSAINGSIFKNNTARGGGAAGGALYVTATNSAINGSIFKNNTARGGGAAGGGLYVNTITSVINGTIFENNTASFEGDALCVKATNSIISMSINIPASETSFHIIARNSVMSLDPTYEGITLYGLSLNMTLYDGICAHGED